MDENLGQSIQADFEYIINAEKRLGIETGSNRITFLFQHGGTVSRYNNDQRVEATFPKDSKYIELKQKYFGDLENKLYLFYPREYKKDIDKNS